MNDKISRRVFSYLLGFLIMTMGIAISVKSNLGVSPVSSIPYTMTCVWGIEMGRATILFHIALVVIQMILLRSKFQIKNLLQVPVGILFGSFTTFCNYLVSYLPTPEHLVIQIVMMVISSFLIAFGIYLYVPADFIPLAGEGTMLAVSKISKIKFSTVKIAFDVSMVVISLVTCLLCLRTLGSVGAGTVFAAVFVGLELKLIHKIGDRKKVKMVDLFMFMGQSNMAGRGVTSEKWPLTADKIIQRAGYEYRAISDPTRLYEMEEPFGVDENLEGGISEIGKKTGSMVTAFTNEYYRNVKVPIVGISASKGGSSILEWQADGAYLTDAIERMRLAVQYLEKENIKIRHRYMLWCQGETDGDKKMGPAEYKMHFEQMLQEMRKQGIEKCFLVRIGNYNGKKYVDYQEIIKAQDELAESNDDVVMASVKFASMKERGLMKDSYHYYQQAYHEVGIEAGENVAHYVNTQ